MRVPPVAWIVIAGAAFACHACTASPGAPDDAREPSTDAAPANPATPATPGAPRVVLPTALATGLDDPRGIALVGDTLYVAERGGGRVVAVPRGGGTLRTVLADRRGPHGIATDGSVLVVSVREAGEVLRVTLDGDVAVIASGLTSPGEVRVHAGDAYWFDLGGDAGAGTLWRASLGGGPKSPVADDVISPSGIATGGSGVYFTALGARGAKGNVFAVVPDSGVSVLAATSQHPRGIAADEAAGWVYWAAQKGVSPGAGEGFVQRTNLDGGTTARLGEAASGVERVVVRDGWLYFTTSQTLSRVPVAGGAIEDLAIQTHAGDLVVTDDAVLWTDSQAGKVYAHALR
jgi:glucose/arabinose dehydrogenase